MQSIGLISCKIFVCAVALATITSSPALTLSVEPDGSIPRANTLYAQAGDPVATAVEGELGDGAFGATSGDFDWYMVAARSGDVIYVDPVASVCCILDIVLYDKRGHQLARNQKVLGMGGDPVDSLPLNFQAPVGDAYYILITSVAQGLPNDPFDPASGNGAQGGGDYGLDITVFDRPDSGNDMVLQEIWPTMGAQLGADVDALTLVGEFPGPGMGIARAPLPVELEAGEVLVADMWGDRAGAIDAPTLELYDSQDALVAEATDSQGLWGSFDPGVPRTQDPFLEYEASTSEVFNLSPDGFVELDTRSGNYQVAASVVEPGIEIVGALSGAWYNPADDGQGCDVEVVQQSGGQTALAVAWFTTDLAGNAFWVQGAAKIQPGKGYVVVPVFAARTGSRFGPFYESMELSRDTWGYLVFTFQDCDHGTVYYGSNFGFGTAKYPIRRITSIAGLSCPPN